MASRTILFQKLEKARSFAEQKDFSSADNEMNQISDAILFSKFYPIIGEFYLIKTLIDENKNDFTSLMLDYLICLSPYISINETSVIESKFKNLIQSSNSGTEKYILDISQNLINLLPFDIQIKYLKTKIISGQKFGFYITIENKLHFSFKIDQIKIIFVHNNLQEITCSIPEINLSMNETRKMKLYGSIPNAVRTQTINMMSIQIGKFIIQYIYSLVFDFNRNNLFLSFRK